MIAAIIGGVFALLALLGGGFLWLANAISRGESDMWEPKGLSLAAKVKRRWSILWAARLVSRWEGYLPVAILDPIASPPVATGGYGHSDYAAPPHVRVGERWGRTRSLRVLAHDCRSAAGAVDQKIHHKLTVRQRMALIDFAYNLGAHYLDDLAPLINRSEIAKAADKMLEYDHAGGVVVQGLLNRRRAERWLMLHPKAPGKRPRPKKADQVHTRGERRPS